MCIDEPRLEFSNAPSLHVEPCGSEVIRVKGTVNLQLETLKEGAHRGKKNTRIITFTSPLGCAKTAGHGIISLFG